MPNSHARSIKPGSSKGPGSRAGNTAKDKKDKKDKKVKKEKKEKTTKVKTPKQ